jgi:uncharacterized protein (TIGR03437 family)
MRMLLCLACLSFSNLAAQTAFVTGSGYVAPPSIVVAPGQIATFYVGGLSQTPSVLQNTVAQIMNGTVPQAVTVFSAKPINTSTLAITVQIPFSILPASTPTIQFGQRASAQADPCAQNACSAPLALSVTPVLSHIITTCDVFYATPTTTCHLVITHQDGSIVTNSAAAKVGEVLTIWALGLGVPASGIPSPGSGPIAMNDITLNLSFAATTPIAIPLPGSPNNYQWAGLPSPTTGLYQINFAVPQPPATLQGCSQSSEWFTTNNAGNLFVSIFRFPITVTGNILFEVFPSILEGPNAICVTQ